MMDRLAVGPTLGTRGFAATTAGANPVYDITLLGLVAQPPRFVGLGGAESPVQLGQWAGEMAQRLRALPALPKVLSSIPSNHMMAYNHL